LAGTLPATGPTSRARTLKVCGGARGSVARVSLGARPARLLLWGCRAAVRQCAHRNVAAQRCPRRAASRATSRHCCCACAHVLPAAGALVSSSDIGRICENPTLEEGTKRYELGCRSSR
jgi:hypothetical protein